MTAQHAWRHGELDGQPIKLRNDSEGWWHVQLGAYGPTVTASSRDGAYALARAAVKYEASRKVADAAAAMLDALQRAETRLYVAQCNGFDVPADDLAAIRAAIAAAEGRADA